MSVAIRMLLPVSLLVSSVGLAHAQKTHRIGIEANREDEIYRFFPEKVTVAPGDIVVFKVISGAPHNITFDSEPLSPAAKTALSNALGGKSGELSSPMLAKNGAEYRLMVPKLPPGTYTYFCLPHRAYDMRGELIVKK